MKLDHIDAWVFDLDNTLYPASARLFDQIEVKMTDWVMDTLKVDRDQANRLRQGYWEKYGTTLSGLMTEHGVDPLPYLTHVHDISLHMIAPDPLLAARIKALPGRKIVYTNGSRNHAERVTDARGLTGAFDALYGIEDAGFRPKPERAAFETILGTAGIVATTAAMFEDDHRNLLEPHAMGMSTIHVHATPHTATHIHHATDDLTAFLGLLSS